MGDKGSGATKSYDYFGDIAGLATVGQNAELLAIITDQKEVWPRFAPWKTGVSATTSTYVSYGGKSWHCVLAHTTASDKVPPHATYWEEYKLEKGGPDYSDLTVNGYGGITNKWGTTGQVQDSALGTSGNNLGHDHPSYVGDDYFILKNFLFGRERTSAPNMQAVMRRLPSQSIITGSASELRDGQTNPLCTIAELLTSARNGLRIPSGTLDSTSWQAAADHLYTNRDLCYWSVLLTSQTTIRSLIADASNMTDCWIRWNPTTRKIEAGVWKHSVEPVSYTTITVDMLDESAPPRLNCGGWADAKTGVGINFTDRERIFKQSSDKVDDPRALTIVGENRRENVQRPHITRRKQAIAHAAETLRTVGRPQVSGEIVVRREHAKNIRPGDWIRLDIDLEPGGTQLLQYFHVVERTVPHRGSISLSIEADETLYPVSYTPAADTPGVIPTDDVPAISEYAIWVPPYKLSKIFGDVICILAKREDPLIVGASVWFDHQAPAVEYQNIGKVISFGAVGYLTADYAATATTDIQVGFDDQTDVDRLTASISEVAASDDELLLIVFSETDGVRDVDDDLYEYVEIMSVSAITPPASPGDPHELTVTRGVYGTNALDFVVSPPIGTRIIQCWLVYRKNLAFLTHKSFETLAQNAAVGDGATDYVGAFKIQPFTAYAAQPIADCTELGYAWPRARRGPPILTWISPDYSGEPVPGTKEFASSPTVEGFGGVWNDVDGDIESVGLYIRKAGEEETVLMQRDTILTGSITFLFSYEFTTLSADTWEIIARCKDAAGYVSQSVLIVRLDVGSVSSTKVKTPYAQFASGKRIGNKVNFVKGSALQIKCDTSGSSVRYKAEQTSASNGSPPAGSWSASPITTLAFVADRNSVSFPGHRIWLKGEKSGLADSDVSYFDIGYSQ